MDTHQTIDSSQPLRSWLAWAGLLVALYLAVGFVGWGRSLIGTEIWALYYAGQPFNELMQAIRNDLVHPPLIYMVSAPGSTSSGRPTTQPRRWRW